MVTNSKKEQNNSYLTFKIGEETYAIHVNFVKSIIQAEKFRRVPEAPPYLKGLINYYGILLPVVDGKIKMGVLSSDTVTQAGIIQIETFWKGHETNVGLLVDAVCDVLQIAENEIEMPPLIGSAYKGSMIDGFFRNGDDILIILNTEHLFSDEEKELFSNIMNQKFHE
ncbi:MAG: chemotaxis protein CheW [Bacteroidales bacterium]